MDLLDQVADAAESSVADSFARDFGKPRFDLVEPGGAGRREVHVMARWRCQPFLYLRMFVSSVLAVFSLHLAVVCSVQYSAKQAAALRHAGRPKGSSSTRGKHGITVTDCRLLAQVVHVNEDPLGMVRAKLSRAYRAEASPASLRGPSGHSSITWI